MEPVFMDLEFQITTKKVAELHSSENVSPLKLLARRSTTPLSIETFIDLSEWVAKERLRLCLTQVLASARLQIPLRRLKTYEALALWPIEAKAFVRDHSENFSATSLTRLFIDRSWKTKETLINGLRRHVEGKPPRQRSGATHREALKDPNILALEDRLKSALHTRVSLIPQGNAGEIRITYFNLDELDRLLGILEGT